MLEKYRSQLHAGIGRGSATFQTIQSLKSAQTAEYSRSQKGKGLKWLRSKEPSFGGVPSSHLDPHQFAPKRRPRGFRSSGETLVRAGCPTSELRHNPSREPFTPDFAPQAHQPPEETTGIIEHPVAIHGKRDHHSDHRNLNRRESTAPSRRSRNVWESGPSGAEVGR
jgi:hypothetical protein